MGPFIYIATVTEPNVFDDESKIRIDLLVYNYV